MVIKVCSSSGLSYPVLSDIFCCIWMPSIFFLLSFLLDFLYHIVSDIVNFICSFFVKLEWKSSQFFKMKFRRTYIFKITIVIVTPNPVPKPNITIIIAVWLSSFLDTAKCHNKCSILCLLSIIFWQIYRLKSNSFKTEYCKFNACYTALFIWACF